jgi:predicted transcriptional regulator
VYAKRAYTTQPRRGLYTPLAIQANVIARALAGKSKSELHRETGLGRGSIQRILSQSEAQAILASYRDQIRDLVPAAIRLCGRKLKGNNASWQLAIEILKGCQVLVTRQTKDIRETHDEIYSLTDDQLRKYIRTGKMPLTTPTDVYRRSA